MKMNWNYQKMFANCSLPNEKQPEQGDVENLAYEFAAEVCFNGKGNSRMTLEEITEVFKRAMQSTQKKKDE